MVVIMPEKPTYEELEKRIAEKEKIEAEYKLAEQYWRLSNEVLMIHKKDLFTPSSIYALERIASDIGGILLRKQAEEALRESEERFKTIIQNLPGAVFAHDLEGRILFINKTAPLYTGYSEQELLAMTVFDIDSGDFTRDDMYKLWNGLNAGESKTIESTHTRKNGLKYPVEVHLNAISLDNQPVILPIAIDITERKQAETALAESMNRYEELSTRVPVGVYIVWLLANGRFEFEYVNDRWCEIHQIRREEVLTDSKAVNDLVHPDERESFLACNRQAMLDKKPFLWEGRFIAGSEVRWLRIESASVSFDNGDTRWFGVTQDITERKQMEEALSHLATVDDLTGLFNRRTFIQRLNEEISRTERSGGTAVIMMLDLDHFKTVNDIYGHVIGDKVLRKFAALLRSSIREIDIPGRLGGEEFGVILPETTMEAATPVIRRILKNTRRKIFETEAGDIHLTTSIGYTCFNVDVTKADELLARADQALYRGKKKGRDRAEAG